MSLSFRQEESDEARALASESSRDPTVIAALASIALSLYYFYIKGDRERGLFVGLWAPTLLSLANYTSMAKVRNEIRKLTNPGQNIRESVQRMISNR
mgnify:CR=1 FL=1